MPFCSPYRPNLRSCLAPISTPRGDIAVRPIRADDAPLAQAFVSSLSATARYFRFFQVITRLSPALLDRFLTCDGDRHLTIVATTMINGQPQIIGEARYIAAEDGVCAEFAIAITDQWQRMGLARGLIDRLEACATGIGIRQFRGETLPNNEPLLAFARATGFRVWADADNIQVLRLGKCIAL